MDKKQVSHYLSDIAREAARNAAAADFSKEIIDKVMDTPCFLISEAPLRRNLEILAHVKKKTGAKILMALKAFAMPMAFPIIKEYLDGICASGPMEAQLGREFFGKEVHTFGPAYSEEDMKKLLKYSDAIIFNSVAQWKRYRGMIAKSKRKIEVGLRLNPKYSEIKADLYNPALPGAGMGIIPEELKGEDLEGVDGLHFHALCENNAGTLVHVLDHFEKLYGKYIPKMKWVNFGGGHHITRVDYDVDLLINTINAFKEKHGVEVHLEPGETISLNSGVLVSTVLDVMYRKEDGREGIAVLDASAHNHMPDVIKMPYKPDIIGAGEPGETKHTYRLRGPTCVSMDIIGEYSFPKALKPGDRIVLLDMALYTFVQATTFNGIKLPSLAFYDAKTGRVEIAGDFGYEDYKSRLSNR